MVRIGRLSPPIIWLLWNQHIELGCIEVVTFFGVIKCKKTIYSLSSLSLNYDCKAKTYLVTGVTGHKLDKLTG